MKKPETGSKSPQVQIRLMGSDGEWYQPSSHASAVLTALRAMREDIAQCGGSYSDSNLRSFREALRELDEQISKRTGKGES